MKNLIVLAVFFISVSSSFAETNPKINFDGNKNIIVDLNDWNNSDIKIEIKDLNGEILHKDQLQKGALKKKYNLKNLPAGRYELLISSEMKKAIYPILVSNDRVEMLPVENPVVYKPTLEFKNNNIELNQLALGRTVTVSFSDITGTFFTKTYKNEANINTKFDVTELPSGDYTVAISGKNQYDTFNFKK